MNLFKLEGITHPDGSSREDGKYPLRRGSTFELTFINNNMPMILEYVSDNQGNPKEGSLVTSKVQKYDYVEDDELYIVETLNSIYYLHKIT